MSTRESEEYWRGYRDGRARRDPDGTSEDYKRGFLDGDSAADEAENGEPWSW